MAPINWATYLERAVGKGHPTLSDTVNRALRQLLTESGYDPDASPFPGLMGPVFNVKAFAGGAPIDNGTTSASAALAAAEAAAAAVDGIVFFPPHDPSGGYLLTSQQVVSSRVRILGSHKASTRLILGFNGDMFNVGERGTLENLWLDGNGALFTGRGITISGGQGGQNVLNCRVISFNGYCIDFLASSAGSQFYCANSELAQLVGASAGQEAVHVDPTWNGGAVPHTFVGVQTQGLRFADFGGCDNFFVVGSRIGDCLWTDASRAVLISGTRIAGQAAGMTVKGANHSVTSCDIFPQITIAAGCQNVSFRGNSYNNPPFIDQAFSATNVLEDQKSINRVVGSNFVTFSDGDLTPSVGQGRDFAVTNTSPASITNFDDGVNGQRIVVRLNNQTTIVHNSSLIRLKGSVNLVATSSDQMVAFVRLNAVWFEEYRNF